MAILPNVKSFTESFHLRSTMAATSSKLKPASNDSRSAWPILLAEQVPGAGLAGLVGLRSARPDPVPGTVSTISSVLQLAIRPRHRIRIDRQFPGQLAHAGNQFPAASAPSGHGKLHLPGDLVVNRHAVIGVDLNEHAVLLPSVVCTIVLVR